MATSSPAVSQAATLFGFKGIQVKVIKARRAKPHAILKAFMLGVPSKEASFHSFSSVWCFCWSPFSVVVLCVCL